LFISVVDMKILLLEQEKAFQVEIADFLEKEGHWCEVQDTPVTARISLTADYYDVVIFNVTALNEGEKELLKFLKQTGLNRKAILTYQINEVVTRNKVQSLDIISLEKPYGLTELAAKMNAVFNYEHSEPGEVFFFNEIKVNVPGRMVHVKNKAVNLTRLEYDLLLYFITNRARILSKHAIAQQLAYDDSDTLSDFGFLYAHIKNLKRKLKALGCSDYIKTVYGVGYRFEKDSMPENCSLP